MVAAYRGRASRNAMDKAELETQGFLSGTGSTPPEDVLCQQCHRDKSNSVACDGRAGTKWKNHLIEGRVAEVVWEDVSTRFAGSTCGW